MSPASFLKLLLSSLLLGQIHILALLGMLLGLAVFDLGGQSLFIAVGAGFMTNAIVYSVQIYEKYARVIKTSVNARDGLRETRIIKKIQKVELISAIPFVSIVSVIFINAIAPEYICSVATGGVNNAAECGAHGFIFGPILFAVSVVIIVFSFSLGARMKKNVQAHDVQ